MAFSAGGTDGSILAGLRRRLVDCVLDDFSGLFAAVRPFAGQDPEQDRAQAVDVGALVDLVNASRGLFGRHVRRRAERLADRPSTPAH